MTYCERASTDSSWRRRGRRNAMADVLTGIPTPDIETLISRFAVNTMNTTRLQNTTPDYERNTKFCNFENDSSDSSDVEMLEDTFLDVFENSRAISTFASSTDISKFRNRRNAVPDALAILDEAERTRLRVLSI